GNRGWNRVVEPARRLQNRRTQVRADALGIRERPRCRADRHAALGGNVFEAYPPGERSTLSLRRHRSMCSSDPRGLHSANNFQIAQVFAMWNLCRGFRMHSGGAVAPSAGLIRSHLERLVGGMTALRHDGRFDEPNLDGTAGDYISFDSWEWPQGVGLYGLARLWLHTQDPALRAILDDWYARQIGRGLPALNVN